MSRLGYVRSVVWTWVVTSERRSRRAVKWVRVGPSSSTSVSSKGGLKWISKVTSLPSGRPLFFPMGATMMSLIIKC